MEKGERARNWARQRVSLKLRLPLLRALRAWQNLRDSIPFHRVGELEFPVVASVECPLKTTSDPAERMLELGKIQNLRLIARKLNGLVIPKDSVFSFWRQVGPLTRAGGYVPGRQIEAGCVVPAIGGGVCALTNLLYEAAVKAGFEIVERHPHTVRPQGANLNRPDATVAWNHLDLRIRHSETWRLEVRLDSERLYVTLRSLGTVRPQKVLLPMWRPTAESCETCGEAGCEGKRMLVPYRASSPIALLDSLRPEFAGMLTGTIILTGHRKLGSEFRTVKRAWWTGVRGALRQRQLAHQGAERQKGLILGQRELAAALAKLVPIEAEHLFVDGVLLPHLYKLGALGGRTYDVLLTRLPIASLHRVLDEAAKRYPERTSLADFRADRELVAAETEALVGASRIYTAHAAVGEEFPARSELVPWPNSETPSWTPGKAILFPGPAIARKGAFEVREVARRLGLPVILLGRNLEAFEFWDGVELLPPGDEWLTGAAVLVQPAWIEDRPLRLLSALAAGCPVVATSNCGLVSQKGLTLVPPGDPDALEAAVRAAIDA
ncbi:glycosyltransferase [bacterium]|nr:MAG: glycosyltransferase [bacterium]